MPNQLPVHDVLCNAQMPTIAGKSRSAAAAECFCDKGKESSLAMDQISALKVQFHLIPVPAFSQNETYHTFQKPSRCMRRKKERKPIKLIAISSQKNFTTIPQSEWMCAEHARSFILASVAWHSTLSTAKAHEKPSQEYESELIFDFSFTIFFSSSLHHRRQTFSSALSVDATCMCVCVSGCEMHTVVNVVISDTEWE